MPAISEFFILAISVISLRNVAAQLEDCYSHCVLEEVTCTCRPSSRFFNWRIITTDGNQESMAFANSPNGTLRMWQRYSIQTLVFYDSDNMPVSQLMMTASLEIHGATIACDQFSIMFYINAFVSPTMSLIGYKISNETNSYYYDINLIYDYETDYDYTVIISSAKSNLQAVNISSITTGKYNFVANIKYNFTLDNTECSDSDMSTFTYYTPCPLLESCNANSIKYTFSQKGCMNASLEFANGLKLYLTCLNGSQWNCSSESCCTSGDSTTNMNNETLSTLYDMRNDSNLLLYILLPLSAVVAVVVIITVLSFSLTLLIRYSCFKSKRIREEQHFNEFENSTYQTLNNAYVEATANKIQLAQARSRKQDYSTMCPSESKTKLITGNQNSNLLPVADNSLLLYDTVMNKGVSINEETSMAEVVEINMNNDVVIQEEVLCCSNQVTIMSSDDHIGTPKIEENESELN